MSRAEKLAIAQAIGGTRQYNQVLVLMEHWDEVLRNVTNSMNAKGSAEAKNAILMETYSKKLAQTKRCYGRTRSTSRKVSTSRS